MKTRNFYKKQCRVLEKQLSDAEEILIKHIPSGDSTDSSDDISWTHSAVLELIRMLKSGKDLIKVCHYESCLKAYLRWGERTMAFEEILKEIIWCMSVGFNAKSKRCLPGKSLADVAMDEIPAPELGAHKELCILKMAVSDDEKELLKSLDVWIEKHTCSAKECGGPQQCNEEPPCCIATQILKRRNNETKYDNIARIQKSSEVDRTAVLWNINSKILPEDGKIIGSGAYGTVTETKWLGHPYAKKTFRMESTEGFRDEVNALSKLTHPHMVTLLACSVDADSQMPSLLMEKMPYDLRQYMDKRKKDGINPLFSIPAAVDLMLQGAKAMRYMHSKKMVHRDLKPANILVKPTDDPELYKEGFVIAKLADFGLATLKNEVTNYSHLTKNRGTRRYMAPEVFKADEDNEEHLRFVFPMKVDVFSFGIVCSEILTGNVPFNNVKMSDLYKLLTNSENQLRPELPESCPEILASLICQCWDTNPRRRPNFTDICKRLRYFKCLLMMTGSRHLEPWMETKLRSLLDVELKHDQLNIQQLSSTSYDPYCLYTTFNGSSWTTPVPLSLSHQSMASPSGMSLVDYNGILVGVYRRVEQWNQSRELYWSTFTNSSWSQPQMITSSTGSQTSPSRPALATFRERLYCLYRGDDNQIWCTSAGSNLDYDSWTPPVNTGGNFNTINGPALVRYGDSLISVSRGFNNYIYWDSYNGLEWRGNEVMKNRATTSESPAIAVYKNELSCCIIGMDGCLHWAKFLGTKWSYFSKLTDYQLGILSHPSLAVFNEQLVCTVLKIPENELYYTTFDGSHWSQVKKVLSGSSFIGEQGLCTFNSLLYCVYRTWPHREMI